MLSNSSFAHAFPYQIPTVEGGLTAGTLPTSNSPTQSTNIGNIIKIDAVKDDTSLLIKLMKALGVNTTSYNGDQKALYYIRYLINYALGFVSFIAFLLLLYSFYMMLIGDGEKGREKAKSTLKGIAIALIILALSWLIVSMLFRIYSNQVKG